MSEACNRRPSQNSELFNAGRAKNGILRVKARHIYCNPSNLFDLKCTVINEIRRTQKQYFHDNELQYIQRDATKLWHDTSVEREIAIQCMKSLTEFRVMPCLLHF